MLLQSDNLPLSIVMEQGQQGNTIPLICFFINILVSIADIRKTTPAETLEHLIV